MPDLNKTYLYRMTHIENVPHILEHGVTHVSSTRANKNYKAIGDNSIISTRNNFDLPNGKKLGAYIPFYFGARMPMLYVIQKGFNGVAVTPAKDIVYCISSVQKVVVTNYLLSLLMVMLLMDCPFFMRKKIYPTLIQFLIKEP